MKKKNFKNKKQKEHAYPLAEASKKERGYPLYVSLSSLI